MEWRSLITSHTTLVSIICFAAITWFLHAFIIEKEKGYDNKSELDDKIDEKISQCEKAIRQKDTVALTLALYSLTVTSQSYAECCRTLAQCHAFLGMGGLYLTWLGTHDILNHKTKPSLFAAIVLTAIGISVTIRRFNKAINNRRLAVTYSEDKTDGMRQQLTQLISVNVRTASRDATNNAATTNGHAAVHTPAPSTTTTLRTPNTANTDVTVSTVNTTVNNNNQPQLNRKKARVINRSFRAAVTAAVAEYQPGVVAKRKVRSIEKLNADEAVPDASVYAAIDNFCKSGSKTAQRKRVFDHVLKDFSDTWSYNAFIATSPAASMNGNVDSPATSVALSAIPNTPQTVNHNAENNVNTPMVEAPALILTEEELAEIERKKKRAWPPMTDAEKPIVNRLRAALTEAVQPLSPKITDTSILRFYRGMKRDERIALRELIKHARWRNENNIDTIENELPTFQSEFNTRKAILQGRDFEGRPCSFQFPHRHIPRERAPIDVMRRMIIFACEYALARTNKDEERYVIIFDLSRFTLACMDYELVKAIIDVLQQNYPDTLERLYIIDSPLIFSACWAIIRPWLDPVSQGKVMFIKRAQLGEYIDMSTAPSFLDDPLPPACPAPLPAEVPPNEATNLDQADAPAYPREDEPA